MKKRTSAAGRIFLSYRREDSSGYAGRLFDRITRHFGKDRVFMDISDIEPGVDFVDTIEKALSSCDAFLVLIGKDWLDCRDSNGRRRLNNPDDFIRLETATALKRNVRVIPVLVRGATMPTAADLPEEMAALARRNAQELSDLRWDFDCGQLIEVLEKVVGVPPPAPSSGAAEARRARLSIKAIAALVLVALVVLGFGAEETVDNDTVLGGIVLGVIALALAVSAFFDARLGKVRGKGLAVTGIALAILVCLGGVGNLIDTPAPDVPPSAVVPDALPAQRVDVPAQPLTRSSGNRVSQQPREGQSTSLPRTIGGPWQGSDGLRYLFNQQGDHLQVFAVDNFQNQVMQGEGSFVAENRIELEYLLADYTTGQASFTLSDDGRQLHGRYHNLATGFSGVVTLFR